jgi:ABC-type glycerol-3-phosphate transport system substrate-binding protein
MLSRPVTTFVCTSQRVFAAGLLGVMIAVRALGAGAVTELDIPIFTGGYGIKFYEETARQFEALRPEVKIKIYGDPRNVDKVRIRVINGNFPDATLTRDLLVPALVHAGKLRDLRPFLAGRNWEGDGSWGDSFLPGALETWRVEEGIYGVPFTYSCWTIFYDQKFFREHGFAVPRTWDEFLALCEKIRATGRAPLSWPGVYGHYPDAFFRAAYYNLAGAEGWRALNALAPGARLDPRYLHSAALLQRLAQNYLVRGWEGMTHTAAQQAFLLGQSAMTVSGSWFVNEMEGKIPAGFELGVMNFPVFPDGVADPTTIQTGSDCFFVFATGDPQRERLTLDFLRFLTSRGRAEAFVRRMDSLVAVRGVPRAAYSPRMQEAAEMVAQAKESFNMPQVMLQTPAVRQASVDERFALMTGQITPQQFGERMEAAAATDRASLAEPGRVQIRHPIGGHAVAAAARQFRRLVGLAETPVPINGCDRGPGETAGTGRIFRAITGADGAGFRGAGVLPLRAGRAAAGGHFVRVGLHAVGRHRPAHLGGALQFQIAAVRERSVLVRPRQQSLPGGRADARGGAARLVFRHTDPPRRLGQKHVSRGPAVSQSARRHRGDAPLDERLRTEWRARQRGPRGAGAGAQHRVAARIRRASVAVAGQPLRRADPDLHLDGVRVQPDPLSRRDGRHRPAALRGGGNRRRPAWWQFFGITLPLIWEVIVIAAVFIVISGLNAFEMIWLLSSQDPTAGTHTLGTLLVTTMFKEFQIGRATAIAVLMFVFVLVGSAP